MKSLSLHVAVALLGVSGMASAQQPPATQSNLDAGGLRPPDAVDSAEQAPPGTPADTPEQELERADKEDAGRGLEWVWLNAEVGGQHLGLQTFKANDLVDGELIEARQTGLLYGGGLGLRILNYTAGVRFRMGSFGDWSLWTLDAEGQFRIPIGRLEPYATVGAGYASLGSFATASSIASKAKMSGFNARVGVGLDYYLSNTFSLGGNLSGDLLVLSRSAVEGAAESSEPSEQLYGEDGSSIGAGATLTLVVGLHF